MISEKKKNAVYWFLILSCAFVWIMMMGSKNVYIAEIEVIMGVFDVTDKAKASLAMTYYFITYSIVQIVLFFILNKLNIKWFMFISIGLSGVVTVIIAFATAMWQLWWILALNGILQAGVWACCMAVLKKYLPLKLIPVANTILNMGTAIAGVISYGTPSIFVGIGRWDLPFIILGIILSVSALLFFISVTMAARLPKEQEDGIRRVELNDKEQPVFNLDSKNKKTVFYILTFALSFLIHALFYGVMNWMPSLLTDKNVFGLSASIGILITVLAPIATAVGPIIAVANCEKHKNFVAVCFIYLAISLVFALLLMLFCKTNLLLSIILLIIFLVAVQCAVTVILSIVSFKTGKYIDVGAHGGLMNAAGAIAAGFTPTIVGAVIDSAGWNIGYAVIFGLNLVLVAWIGIILLKMRNSIKKVKD